MTKSNRKQKILLIAGARPNFMKIAPLMRELRRHPDRFDAVLVHTGQHYDFSMSEVFFKNLNIPKPGIYLNVGSGSHAVQTARVMETFEKVALKEKPGLVIVVGDVNSTMACSITAAKLKIKVAHVEAGLRSFDRTMPEEINRIVTDSLSDLLFVTEDSGLKNLKKEGVPFKKIHFVGNIMIDTLLTNMPRIDKSGILKKLNSTRATAGGPFLTPGQYCVLTLHRPANVDTPAALSKIFDIIRDVSRTTPIIYPVHPRTLGMLKRHGFYKDFNGLNNLLMIEPVGYIDFIHLVKNARFVLTDSGGIQEETTVLNIPCITMRENTERPVTIKEGTNYLAGLDKQKILKIVSAIRAGKAKQGRRPKYWDGKTAERIVTILEK